MSLLRKLFGKGDAPAAEEKPRSVGDDEPLEALYEEFCTTVCVRPGVLLMEHLKAEGHTELIEWLHWDTDQPEPKSLIRAAVAMARGGRGFWEVEGPVRMTRTEGSPPPHTAKALADLAKVLGLGITLYCEEPDGGETVIEFPPE